MFAWERKDSLALVAWGRQDYPVLAWGRIDQNLDLELGKMGYLKN